MQLFNFTKHQNSRKRQKLCGVSKIQKRTELKMLGGKILMNKFLRVLGLGLMIATFAFVGFAQEPTRESVYKKYTDNFESTDPVKIQVAIDAAKEYIAKFTTADDEPQVTYFKGAIPTLEQSIIDIKKKEMAGAESKEWYALLGKFEGNIKAKSWAEAYATGKEILNKQTTNLDAATIKSQKLDVAIILGVIGFDRAAEKNDTFNNEGVNYLKQAIQQIEAGQSSKTFGLLGYELKDKENALGLMNYYIGYIMYYRQKKEDEALPYFYKATQLNSAAKNFPAVYEKIGLKYYNKLAELDPKRLALIEAAPDKKDTPETLAMLAEEKGVADRGIEAYAKAIKMADADPKISKEYKDTLRANFEQLYKFRYGKTDGLDAAISAASAKPLTNPTEPIKPVVEEEKAPETTTSSTMTTTTSTTPSTTKPAESTVMTKTTKTTGPLANGAKTTVKTTTTEAKTTTPKKPRKR